MRCIVIVGVLALGLASCAAAPKVAPEAAIPPANPEAVAAYNEGMRLLEQYQGKRDFTAIEELFVRAANLGLPHAYYGLACTIYSASFHTEAAKGRTREAYNLALYAATHGVLEAQALLINYEYSGFGTPAISNYSRASLLVRQLYDRANDPKLVTGAPGTITIGSAAAARRLITHALVSGICAQPFYSEPMEIWVPYQAMFPTPDDESAIRTTYERPRSADPEAIAVYRKGVDLLDRPKAFARPAEAEELFVKAAALGLPHARFALACVIYVTNWKDRKTEMLDHLDYAMDHGLFEAHALSVWFARLLAISPGPFDMTAYERAWDKTVRLSQAPVPVDGITNTVGFEGPDDALRITFEIVNTGNCVSALRAGLNSPTR
jgi:TPR repeat protein